ncbi:hypothetical protein [Salinicola sp. V024]|uniref:hypothetical protein n=1 Tax=Salinicola sp. V024 TaxID=3459609 RepID=UPI004044E5E6
MKQEERQVVKALWSCVPLIILGGLIPVVAYFSFFRPESEAADIWFQRSGSISVIFGVWTEYSLSKVNEHINLSGIVVSDQTELSERFKLRYRIAQYLGAALAIIGTVIWGYGDLFREAI